MGGGLMQLVAYGAQDVYLTGNPQITFWKVTYRRHTNFAMESIEQTFNGQADFGRRVTCTISRNGDLAYRTYLQVTLPEINQHMNPNTAKSYGEMNTGPYSGQGVYARWLDFPGEQLISQVEVEIGGQRIDRQYGDWMHIWNQLTLSAEQERGYNKMVGNTTQLTFITDPLFDNVDGPCTNDAPRQVCAPRNALPETTLYVPLQFWFCRNPGLALPLIALQYHEVRINLDLRPIDECLWAVDRLANDAGPDANSLTNEEVANVAGRNAKNTTGHKGDACGKKVAAAYAQSLVAASLYVDYVFLDTDERRRMAQNPHEYLIEQLQFTGDESVGSSSNKIKLNFNHPCKELIWVVQPDENVDYCASFDCNQTLFQVFGAQPFNYTDAIDALPNAIHSFGSESSIAGPAGYGSNGFITDAGLFQQAGASDFNAQGGGATLPNVFYSAGEELSPGTTVDKIPSNNLVRYLGLERQTFDKGQNGGTSTKDRILNLLYGSMKSGSFGDVNFTNVGGKPAQPLQQVASIATQLASLTNGPNQATKGAGAQNVWNLLQASAIFNYFMPDLAGSSDAPFDVVTLLSKMWSDTNALIAKSSGDQSPKVADGATALFALGSVMDGKLWHEVFHNQLSATTQSEFVKDHFNADSNDVSSVSLEPLLRVLQRVMDVYRRKYVLSGVQPDNVNDAGSYRWNDVGSPSAFNPREKGQQVNQDGTVVGGYDSLGGWDKTYSAGNLNSYYNGQQPANPGVSDAGTFVLTETSLTMHCWGENPVITAKLQLNGQDRFSEREGNYFDLVQPYQHHTRNPDTGINVYSFALRPEEHQPSGTCNFSRIDNATLQLILSNATVEGTKTAKVRVYATNYNVLRIMSGMGGLAYSN